MKMTLKTSANNITGIPNNHKVDKPFGNAHCIYDPKTLQCRDDSINSWTSINYSDNQIKHNFFDTYVILKVPQRVLVIFILDTNTKKDYELLVVIISFTK